MAVSASVLPKATPAQSQGIGTVIGQTQNFPTITTPAPPSYSDAYGQASKAIGNPVAGEEGTLGTLAGTIGTQSQTLASGYIAEQPVVQNIYSALQTELSNQTQQQEGNIQQESKAAVGQNRTQAAKQGFNPDTGFTASQSRNIEKGYNQQLQSIAEQYKVDAEQLAAEETKSIDDLQNEATQAILSGDEEQANIIGQVASLKLQTQQLIVSAADSIMSADTSANKAAMQAQYDSSLADVKLMTTDLAAQKLSIQSSGQPVINLMSGGGGSSATPSMQSKQMPNGDYVNYNPKTGQYSDPITGKTVNPNDYGLGGGSSSSGGGSSSSSSGGGNWFDNFISGLGL